MTHRLLDRDEETRLIIAAQNGDPAAMRTLVECNRRLVHKVANYYHRSGGRVAYDDLESEGITGLLIAINRFDTTSGNKLSTYAVPWIRKQVRDYIAKNISDLHIPKHIFDKAQRAELTPAQADGYAKAIDPIPLEQDASSIEASIVDIHKADNEPRERLRIIFRHARLTPIETTCLTYMNGLFGHKKMELGEVGETTGFTHKTIKEALRSGKRKIRIILRGTNAQGKLFD